MFYLLYSILFHSDNRLKKYAQERKDLLDQVAKLKYELEEERIRSGQCYNLMNGLNNEDFDDSSLYHKICNYSPFKIMEMPYATRHNYCIFERV